MGRCFSPAILIHYYFFLFCIFQSIVGYGMYDGRNIMVNLYDSRWNLNCQLDDIIIIIILFFQNNQLWIFPFCFFLQYYLFVIKSFVRFQFIKCNFCIYVFWNKNKTGNFILHSSRSCDCHGARSYGSCLWWNLW